MRQCDVFANPGERPRPNVPFIVVLQSDLVFHTTTVVVAPLVMADGLRDDQAIFPIFEIDGLRVGLAVTELATLPRRALRIYVGSLDEERHRIIRAIDTVFTGA